MTEATPPPAWYDAQYNNRARIPEHPAILAHWAEASARAYERPGWVLDLAYGEDPGERLDLLPAGQPGAPVLVYIHGGYWRALDKRDQSFVAPPFADAGATVVLANYALCPAVTIEHIVLQLVRALAWVHRNASGYGGDPGRIVVAGHSAGGHLATMLLACDWKTVAPDLPADLVKSALSISGLYDLEPLRHAPFLAADIGLTAATALRLSPAAMPAPSQGSLVTVVGGDESEEFHRQAELIGRAWGPRLFAAERVSGRNHMDVLDELADTGSHTHALALRLLGLVQGPVAVERHKKIKKIKAIGCSSEMFRDRSSPELVERRAARAAQLLIEKDRLIKHQKLAIDLLSMSKAKRAKLIRRARAEVARWRRDRLCSPDYADRWDDLLNRPVEELARAMGSDSLEWGPALRQNSPWNVVAP